ncbi:hypothetical protein [Mesorhizobium australafricanum]|uniref:Acid shock protein n=1 Tax=Mesorhizobium australafricanum TaxID=3072311 RepID=A0ABU4WX17_9HYPH|nr:hypothetical protein [Mesorhizobium sp. VK3E]MDX8440610.1 hypothetical protein [Mesorhizobium sp. VK3E]
MKNPLLSALGLAVALAFSMPVLGNAAATTAAAPAATAPAKAAPKKVAAKKVCKVTKTHKCPVKHKKHHKKHAAMAAAPKTAAPKTSY